MTFGCHGLHAVGAKREGRERCEGKRGRERLKGARVGVLMAWGRRRGVGVGRKVEGGGLVERGERRGEMRICFEVGLYL